MKKKKPKPVFAGHPYLSESECDTKAGVYREGIWWGAIGEKAMFSTRDLAELRAKELRKKNAQSENP